MRQNTSSTTGTVAITRARQILNETTPGFWDDTELLQWCNDAIKDLCNRTFCYQATETISLLADTIEYTPTNDYIKIVAVQLTDASGKVWALKPSNPASVGLAPVNLLGMTDPMYWYEFSGKVGVFPAYTAVTSQSIEVFEAKQPAVIAASGYLPTPAVFDTAIVHYMVGMALVKDRKSEFSKGFLSSYEATADRFRPDFIEQPREAAEPVT